LEKPAVAGGPIKMLFRRHGAEYDYNGAFVLPLHPFAGVEFASRRS